MDFFPAFFDMTNAHIVIFGTGEDAARKLRLVERTPARITVVRFPRADNLLETGGHAIINEAGAETALKDAALAIIAAESAEDRDRAIALARHCRVPINVVDQRGLSDFIVPSLIDRGKLVAAITTSGAAPVLGARLRTQLERSLPEDAEALAGLAYSLRAAVRIRYDQPIERRAFWQRFTDLALSGERETLVLKAFDETSSPKRLLGTLRLPSSGSPDDITLGTFRFMQTCDHVLTLGDISKDWLDLVRRDATRTSLGPEWSAALAGHEAFSDPEVAAILLIHAEDIPDGELEKLAGNSQRILRKLT